MSNSDHKTALITGAGRGIGYLIAVKLANNGYNLAICDISEGSVRQAADTLTQETGMEVLSAAVDVSDRNQIQDFVKDTVKHYGSLDVLVNNAGITRDNLSMRMKADEWQSVIDVNLSSVFHASQAALKPMMRARSGRIVNISSVVASMGNAGQLNYCASKGGIDAMTRSLAREVGSRGITVNAVAPGFIATSMTEKLSDEIHARLTAQIPLGYLGQPEDVANAVGFLVSDQAGYISGQVLHVNGGMYM
jgi:3-oxoacyl-[acyl-carrier protein] reductase